MRRGYALALERIGDGRHDGASREQTKLAACLSGRGYDPETVCARIRIRMVSALEDAGDAVAAARAELGHVCAYDHQVTAAWHVLCHDALTAIATKGRRTLRNLSARLRASEIGIEDTVKDSPVAISDGLLRWTMARTEHFEVPGISRPLPTDRAWLALTAVVRDASIEQARSAEEALADYHALGEKSRTDELVIDAKTIGTFRKLCVVVGGPGSGKSLLLRVLAREFAKDSYVSIRVRLRDLATRMQETGCGVEEGLLQLGVDGTGVSREQLRAASLSDLVLLCDGLDECGERQFDIASGLQDISASHPSYRIVVTTRPIGYSTRALYEWRHYEIAPLAEADTAEHLATLCRYGLDVESAERTDELLPRIRTYLKEGSASRILARSPLLLAFGAALFLNWRDPSKTKLELYQRIFRLNEETPAGRKTSPKPPARVIRNRVLNQLGWLIAASPLRAAEELERQCAKTMEQALDMTYLQALAVVEASVAYWEEKGLIERLRHPGIDLIAFIHKTCGEFAAAHPSVGNGFGRGARGDTYCSLEPRLGRDPGFRHGDAAGDHAGAIAGHRVRGHGPRRIDSEEVVPGVGPSRGLSVASGAQIPPGTRVHARSIRGSPEGLPRRALPYGTRPQPYAGGRTNGFGSRDGPYGVVAARRLGGSRVSLPRQCASKHS